MRAVEALRRGLCGCAIVLAGCARELASKENAPAPSATVAVADAGDVTGTGAGDAGRTARTCTGREAAKIVDVYFERRPGGSADGFSARVRVPRLGFDVTVFEDAITYAGCAVTTRGTQVTFDCLSDLEHEVGSIQEEDGHLVLEYVDARPRYTPSSPVPVPVRHELSLPCGASLAMHARSFGTHD